MHARYYNPFMGRFLSVDPTWESADLGRPQTWNRYTYVENNPINRTDPDGRISVGILVSGAINVGYEAIRQVRSGEPVNNTRLFAALGAGFASGAIGPIGEKGMSAVLTGGAVSGVVNGALQRLASGEKATAAQLAVEAASGAAGRGVGKAIANVAVGVSSTSGKLNQLTWKAAVQRTEAAAANAGPGADKLTNQDAAKLVDGMTKAGGAAGNVVGKELKAEMMRQIQPRDEPKQ